MAKSMVERYEQVLVQDPASSVFVELAKALLEKQDAARAIEVCSQGLSHHPGSVAGRVLWGKALIQQGRPADAMEQFDRAIAIDKDNPHAYNLIGEVLLQRGLYRSALPVLRKAAALQPNDGRIKAWLEQTQQALSGGPAPVLAGFSAFDSPPEAPVPEAPPVAAPPGSPPELGEAALADTAPRHAATRELAEERTVIASAPLPWDDGGGTLPFDLPDAQERGERTQIAVRPAGFDGPPVLEESPAAPRAASESGRAGPPILHADSEETELPTGVGLLGEVPSLEDGTAPTQPRAVPPSASAPAPAPAAADSLLGDIPELVNAPAVPKVEVSGQAAAEIAGAYERELRWKLAEASAKPSFWSRHGSKLALGTVVLVVLGVGLGVFVSRRAAQGGQTLGEALGRAERLINKDTRADLQDALVQLERSREMDEDSVRAWALTAYARALLYRDHGQRRADLREAVQALERTGVRSEFAGLALASDVLLAEGKAADAARKALLSSREDVPEVHALAGALQLEARAAKGAVERFKRALALEPRQVRALVALGGYYQDFGDSSGALRVYGSAKEASPEHPAVLVGLAESRLTLEQDVETSLEELEKLGRDRELPPALDLRRQLAHARVLAAVGRHSEARAMLSSVKAPERSAEAQLALAVALRASGELEGAQRAVERAVALQPRGEAALVMLGRVLVDRDRAQEALARLRDAAGPKVALVRGIAAARVADWRRARAELGRTRVNERYPAEAVIYLSLADAAEGEADEARRVLEKTLAATKKAQSDARVALGQILWQQNDAVAARRQFEEAAKDPQDYEGACALGRMLLAQGQFEAASQPLAQSVTRNGSHGEARDALGRALLALGRTQEGLKQFEAWQLDNPGAGASQKGFALALSLAGKWKEAGAAAGRAVRLSPGDPEAHRLRAMMLFAGGDSRGGFAELERANQLDPQDPRTFCEIGHAFIRQGRSENAAKAFEAARRVAPNEACGLIGEHFARLPTGGRNAARALDKVLGKGPPAWDQAFARATQARALLGAGALKEARKAADEAVRLAPFSGRAHFALALVSARLRQEDVALRAFAEAAELEPTDGPARLAYADALARTDTGLDQALLQYEAFLRLASNAPEAPRVKRLLPTLKRRLAAR